MPLTDADLARMEKEAALQSSARTADIRQLISEVRRLRALAGDFFGDLAFMGEYLFCKHHWADLEADCWLAPFNPYPDGSPYFPETQRKPEEP